MPDSHLKNTDIYSDEVDYIGGHWTLYRNNEFVNNLFTQYPKWKDMMLGTHSGWVEKEYTQMVLKTKARLNFIKQEPQLLIHFNHTKKWPHDI